MHYETTDNTAAHRFRYPTRSDYTSPPFAPSPQWPQPNFSPNATGSTVSWQQFGCLMLMPFVTAGIVSLRRADRILLEMENRWPQPTTVSESMRAMMEFIWCPWIG